MKKNFTIPEVKDVSEKNQTILNSFKKEIGKIPNFYAYIAKNGTALEDYLYLQNRKSTLKAKEKEAISLITSQINGCQYCLAAHTEIGKMNGFTDEQIIEIRKGSASFDNKLDILVKTSAAIVNQRGKISETEKEAFFEVGYSEQTLIDVIYLIGDKTISNYIHNTAGFAIDFTLAPKL